MTAALEGGEWSAARPGRTLPPGKTQYPLYRRLGGPQVRSGWAENLVPTGIWSRTVQPVVSRYTDWATRPTLCGISVCISNSSCETTYKLCGFCCLSCINFEAQNVIATSHSTARLPKAHIPFNFSSKIQILCGISPYLRLFSLATYVMLILTKSSITKLSNGKLLYLPKKCTVIISGKWNITRHFNISYLQ